MPSEPVEPLIGQLRTHQLIEQLRTQPLDVRCARENFEQFDQMLPLAGDSDDRESICRRRFLRNGFPLRAPSPITRSFFPRGADT